MVGILMIRKVEWYYNIMQSTMTVEMEEVDAQNEYGGLQEGMVRRKNVVNDKSL